MTEKDFGLADPDEEKAYQDWLKTIQEISKQGFAHTLIAKTADFLKNLQQTNPDIKKAIIDYLPGHWQNIPIIHIENNEMIIWGGYKVETIGKDVEIENRAVNYTSAIHIHPTRFVSSYQLLLVSKPGNGSWELPKSWDEILVLWQYGHPGEKT